jgi:hypothetical protein
MLQLFADSADADAYDPLSDPGCGPSGGGKKKAKAADAGKSPQPRGRPPKGKMWNAEGGTWGDDPNYVPEAKLAKPPRADGEEDAPAEEGALCADGFEPKPKKPFASKAKPSEPGHTPQPRGRPPKGKVWDAVTGTWLDDPHYVPAPAKPATVKKPRVEGAPGCDDDGEDGDLDELGEGLLQKPKPNKTEDGMHAQPRGRPPSGKQWDRESGEWHDDPHFVAKPKVKKSKPNVITGASVVADNVEGAPYADGELGEGAQALVVVDGAMLLPKAPKVSKNEALASGKHVQPRGRPPKGMPWDAEKGEWIGLAVQ